MRNLTVYVDPLPWCTAPVFRLALGSFWYTMWYMRLHGVLGGLTWVGVVSLVVACASGSDNDDDASELPSSPADEVTSRKAADEPPEFKPKFESPTPGGVDPTKDPAPGGTSDCVDSADPGGTESTAQNLPDTDDCDDEMKTIAGRLKSTADVDMFRVKAVDKWCVRATTFEIETANAELCVFMRCNNGNKEGFKGCAFGTEATSDTGLKGCCQAGPGRAVPNMGCSGLFSGYDDSAEFTLRVRQPQTNTCLPYRVKYRY
jgi:hypothetical protein